MKPDLKKRTFSSPGWIPVLVFAALCHFSSSHAAPSDEQIISELQKSLCADSNPPKNAATAKKSKSKSSKTEATATCIECDAKSAVDASKLKGAEANAAPIGEALETAVQKERMLRDLAFFRSLSASKDPDSLEYAIKRRSLIKIELNKFREKSTSTKAVLDGLEKFASDFLNLDVGKGELSPAYKETLRTIVENQISDQPKDEKRESLRNFVTWVFKGSGVARPSKETLAVVQELIESELQKRRKNYEMYKKLAIDYEAKLVAAEQEVIKREKTKQVEPDLPITELQNALTNYEAEYLKRIPVENPGFKNCGMSVAELYALTEYTGDGYIRLNSALRNGGEDLTHVKPFEAVLRSALAKLRPYDGNVIRGAQLPESVLENHKVGAIIEYSAFTSTAIGTAFGGAHRFVIKSKTGKFIAPYSVHPHENEVLFPPGTRYKILKRTENANGSIDFVLEELKSP